MLFQIFVSLPSLVMAEIAWYIRVAIALTCLVVLFAVAIGVSDVFYRRRANGGLNNGGRGHRTPSETRVVRSQPASEPFQQFVGREIGYL
jgi:hypothetical protein